MHSTASLLFAAKRPRTATGAQVAVLAELLGFVRRGDLEIGVLAGALETLPGMSPAAKAALAGMLAENFAPST